MRLLIDSLIACMLVAILAGVILHYRGQTQELDRLRFTTQALSRLQEQINYHAAMQEAKTDEPGFPPAVSPAWFDADIPMNPMVPGRQAWIDLAATNDFADDPPDPILNHPHQAAFWYNPARGIIRARVPRQFTDQESLELYNRTNSSRLTRIPINDPSRQPQLMPMHLPDTIANESSKETDSAQTVQFGVSTSTTPLISTPNTKPKPAAKASLKRPKM